MLRARFASRSGTSCAGSAGHSQHAGKSCTSCTCPPGITSSAAGRASVRAPPAPSSQSPEVAVLAEGRRRHASRPSARTRAGECRALVGSTGRRGRQAVVHLRRLQQARDSAEGRPCRPTGAGRRASGMADTVRRPPAHLSPRSRPAAPPMGELQVPRQPHARWCREAGQQRQQLSGRASTYRTHGVL